jgi:hypothetical protein
MVTFLGGMCFGYFLKPYIDALVTIIRNSLK